MQELLHSKEQTSYPSHRKIGWCESLSGSAASGQLMMLYDTTPVVGFSEITK